MIPSVEKTVSVQSNITGESGQFSVDESALTHIMDVLTNLYSDPEMAVVREYLTNAFDAQVEAGMVPGTDSWTPISITTPSHFQKSYKIRDYGVGMDSTDLAEIYSKYGKSTKTTSNDVVGMLGLGSKCALTYTNSFTITGFKDGVKTTAIVSKNEDNIPVFHIVDTCATDEPNGVEISVPVRDRNSFATKTSEFLKWWGEGLVLVDGNAPKRHDSDCLGETEITFMVSGVEQKAMVEVYSHESRGYDAMGSRLVMGNVAYPVDAEYVVTELSQMNLAFAAYVPIGSVSFPPSREGLFYNTNTKSVIKQVSLFAARKYVERKIEQINGADDLFEAKRIYDSLGYWVMKSSPLLKNIEYNGVPLSTHSVSLSGVKARWDYEGKMRVDTGRTQVAISDIVSDNNSGYSMIITGISGADYKPATGVRRKIEHYIEQKHGSFNPGFVFFATQTEQLSSPWLAGIEIVSLDTIKAIKLPRSQNTTKNVPSFEEHYKDKSGDICGTLYDATDVRGKNVYYISPAAMKHTRYKSGCTASEILKYLPKDSSLVLIGANRFDKFQRDFPNSQHVEKFWKTKVNDLLDKVPSGVGVKDSLSYSELAFCRGADADRIDDPELAEIIRVVRNNSGTDPNLAEAQAMASLARKFEVSVYASIESQETDIFEKYPLVAHVGGDEIAHLTVYINTIYARNQGE